MRRPATAARGRLRLRLGAALLLLACAPHAAWAVRTLRFTETGESLSQGQADGVAVGASGEIFLTPRLTRIGDAAAPGEAAHAFSVAADSRGNVYLGTGPDGRIVKVSASGRQEVFFTVEEPMVTALAFDGTDTLLAAASPGGKIYRIDSDGRGKVWSETGQRYVWALAAGPAGHVWAATGEVGAVYRIDRDGQAELWFEAQDDHVRCLVPQEGGALLAGSAGHGRIYQIDPEGHGLVLYEDEMPEVVSLAALEGGAVIAAFVAEPTREAPRPAVRIALPSGASVSAAGADSMRSIDEEEAETLRGVIEGLPTGDDRRVAAQQGRVVRIQPDGRSEVLWHSRSESPFAVVADGTGSAYFGTGEPARLHRLGADDTIARLATLDEGQLTGLLRLGQSVFLTTSNPAAVYRLESRTAEGGTFVSQSLDAGGPARWGSIRWNIEGAGRVEVYTRTGNSRQANATWSAWSPALVDPAGGAVVNPDGRYLQWRARFLGPQTLGLRLGDVTVLYAPYNRPPEAREFLLDGDGTAVAADASLRWSATDPDGDPVDVRVDYRPAGGGDWSALGRDGDAEVRGSVAARWGDQRVTLDTTALAEGDYEFRLVLSDQAGNPPGEAQEMVRPGRLRLTVDRTPPLITVRPTGAAIEVTVTDAHSDLARLEVQEASTTRFAPRPVDGVCDSRTEVFRYAPPPDAAAGGWTFKAFDAAGNTAEAPVPAP